MATSRPAGAIDSVIGVDPHRDTLATAATDPAGGQLAQMSVSADAAGYRPLFDFARAQVPGRRRRAGSLPAGSRRAGGRGRPAEAAAAAQRGQERRLGRCPRGAGALRVLLPFCGV
jgi:hypothetical protein